MFNKRSALAIVATLAMLAAPVLAAGGDTTLISVGLGGAQANDGSSDPSISPDGRYVAFYSAATNLVAGDTNGKNDIFVRDRDTDANGIFDEAGAVATTLISVDSGGAQANSSSSAPSISSEGRYVAFVSAASNLVAGDTNGKSDIFVRDRDTDADGIFDEAGAVATMRVSVDSAGAQADNNSISSSISSDGRYVAFASPATNLVAGDTNGRIDIFVHDRQTSATTLISVGLGGAQANGNSGTPSISSAGRYVAFYSTASNLVAGDTNGATDAFVHDRDTDADGIFDEIGAVATTLISVDSAGAQANGSSSDLSISPDGRYVAFYSSASNLVAGDTNGTTDAFVRDRDTDADGIFDEAGAVATTLVSVDSGGAQANGGSRYPSLSRDGRYVVFYSSANNLVAGDTNGMSDIFMRDRDTDADGVFDEAGAVATTRVSVDSAGAQADNNSTSPSISSDGRYVAFSSWATNLVAGDTNGKPDVFVYEVDSTAPGVTSFTRQNPATSRTNADALVFRATFGEDVQEVDSGDFGVNGTTTTAVTGVAVVSASVYDVTVSGGDLASFNGVVGLDLAGTQNITDLVGNPLPAGEPAADETYTLDNTEPGVTSFTRQDPATSRTNADRLVFLATFSEAVTGVDTADFAVNGNPVTTATVTDVSQVTTSTYDVTISGGDLAGFNGTVNLNLSGAQDITDLIGNALPPGEPSIDETYTLDNTAPGVTSFTRQDPAASRTNADILVFRATFSEGVQEVDSGDFGVNGTTTAAVTGVAVVSASVYDVTVSGGDLASFNGVVGLDLAGTQDITNLVGTPLPAGEPSTDEQYDVDNTTPSVASNSLVARYTTHPSGFTVTFSEAMNNSGGGSGAEDVTNPANYLLVDIGTNGTPDTSSCSGGVETDDTQVTVSSVSYDSGTFTATVNLAPALPNGSYRLFVCGTTSVADLALNKLNGGLSDIIYEFVVAAGGGGGGNNPSALPKTGFASNKITYLPAQPAEKAYADLGELWLEIPKLGVEMPIVGVPQTEGEWDVSWLGQAAGWLNESAFPTWAGNSVLTGHVWNADNTAGPFAYLNQLWWGDEIIVHAWGGEYVYEVRSVLQVSPGNVSAMMKHEEEPWLTLVTCRGYDEASDSYQYRVLVRAVLVEAR